MKVKLFLLLLLYSSANLNASAIDDSVAYSMGIQLAISLQKNGILNKFEQNASFLEAFNDMKNSASKLTLNDMERVLTTYFTNVFEKDKAENEVAGKNFLENNAKNPGVVVLPSGLQYKIVKQGDGKIKPRLTDNIEVHYRGTLVDGTVFDSSYESGQPMTIQLNDVIEGWKEGLQHITEGGKILLYIPASLAYGDKVMAGGKIGPNSTLIFEIELFKITPPETTETEETK
ncbi:MAG: FKBP-type peptidyl-prolyl cis-trans isomerase [Prevotellaceae bacterium]|jgi:FKBP-type peptidyl-prolyl cis-trans isomerase FklB|nr:FKBP-type peptidyl-prolyl cis-trans isomerase [Prevotellaceae bacterium]